MQRYVLLYVVALALAFSGSVALADSSGLVLDDELHSLRLSKGTAVTPFVAAGILKDDEEGEDLSIADMSPDLYGMVAGINCEVMTKVQLDLGYRYTTPRLADYIPLSLLQSSPGKDDHRFCVDLKLQF